METIQTALTFDDVLLLPGHSNVLPKDIQLTTKLTRSIHLNIPLISAAMDTVTESKLAIALAQEGGIGVIHKNMSIAKQAEQVKRVKRFESSVIRNPITISEKASIKEVLALKKKYQISALPVIKGNTVVGLVTNRDVRFVTNVNESVKTVMTPQDKLITINEALVKKLSK